MAMTEEQIERLAERAEAVVLDRVKAITEAGPVGKSTLTAEDYAFLLAWLQYRVDSGEGYDDEDDYEDYEDEDEDDED